jgi:hypothetical protein
LLDLIFSMMRSSTPKGWILLNPIENEIHSLFFLQNSINPKNL